MTLSRPRLALLAFALLTLTTGLAPAPIAAEPGREPFRPLPGDRPGFVTETDSPPPWKDCLWAAGAMLLDKWTAGEIALSRSQLRKLSRDREGGSTFTDLRTAFGRAGLPLTFSPNGGDFVTWRELLDRLARAGGAVLLGDYGALPRRYGRWDPTFWAKTDDLDNHAMYLDRYDKRRKRIWVMDPLGRGEWDGEWMPVSALKAYAWRTGSGGLWVAMTPPAQAAPFAGVELGSPVATALTDRLTVDWPMAAPEGWALPGVDLVADVVALDSGVVSDPEAVLAVPSTTRVDVPLLPDEVVAPAAVPVPVPVAAPGAAPTLALVPGAVRATLPIPAAGGVHRVDLRIVERRFGRTVATAGPYTVFVPGGPREALIVARSVAPAAEPGEIVEVATTIVNAGTVSWIDAPADAAVPEAAVPPRSTALWARWVAADPELAEDAPVGVRVADLPVEPGGARALWLSVPAPDVPGEWMLMLEVRERRESAFADAGSAPVFVPILVTPPPEPAAATAD